MSLPNSRERTYVPGVPLIADDLNAIQDAIIDGKHAEREHVYAAANFGGASTGGIASISGAQINFSAGATVYCGIQVPAGDRITTIKWGYKVGAADAVTFKLARRIIDGSAAAADVSQVDPIGNPTTDNTGGVFESSTILYNHVVQSGYVYYLLFSTTNGASNLFGASVKADKL